MGDPACAFELRLKGSLPPDVRQEIRRATTPASQMSTAADSARAVLDRHGFLDPRISDSSDTLIVASGPRFTLHAVVAHLDSTTIIPTAPFTPDDVDRVLSDALHPLRDSGYYFARAAIDSITRDGTRITMHISTTPGPPAVLTEQIITGLKRTHPDFIRRYLPLDVGDTLTAAVLARAEQTARTIPFVRLTQPPAVQLYPGFTGVVITWPFEERCQTRLEGLIGYVPEESEALVWTADIRLLNPFGGGRDMMVTSQRRDRGRDILDIAYAQPVFWLGPGELSAMLATRDYREQFYEFKAGAGLLTALTLDTRIGLDLTWRSVEDDFLQRSYASYQAAATLSNSSLDQPYNPSAGFALDWSIAYHYRRYDPDSAATTSSVLNDTRLAARIAAYQPLAAGFVAHMQLAYEGLETNEQLPPLSELVFVGGPGSLRGYRTEQFVALRTVRLVLEPRWRFASGALFAFYDGAYLNNRVPYGDQVTTEESWRYGYGFGLLLSNSLRRVSLSLGWHGGVPIDQPRLAVQLSLDI